MSNGRVNGLSGKKLRVCVSGRGEIEREGGREREGDRGREREREIEEERYRI